MDISIKNTDNQSGVVHRAIKSASLDNISLREQADNLIITALQFADLKAETSIDGNVLTVTLTDHFVHDANDQRVGDLATPNAVEEAIRESVIVDIGAKIEGSTYSFIFDLNSKDVPYKVEQRDNAVVMRINNFFGNNNVEGLLKHVNQQLGTAMYAQHRNAGEIYFNVDSTKEFVQRTYQVDQQIVLEITLVGEKNREVPKPSTKYKQELVDLNFQDIPVRNILDILAEISGKNLVVSDTVTGNMTVRLSNVPWDQAIEIILRSRGLAKREEGNVIMIGTADEIEAREQKELETIQKMGELKPLTTDYVQVKYRPASEVAGLIKEANILTPRGTMMADDKTNLLMIRDLKPNLKDAKGFAKKVDLEVNQIMIEAQLITTTVEMAKELGVRWGIEHSMSINGNALNVGGAITDAMSDSSRYLMNDIGSMVDLGVGQAASSVLNIGFVGSDILLGAELSALQSENKVEILSQPKVITSNGNKAKVSSGQEVAYQTIEDDSVETEFKEIALSLEVKPHINPGNIITLNLNINQDSLTSNPFGSELLINTNSLETVVNVANGETIVLGGVFRKDVEDDVRRTPVLSDIPILGNAFKYKGEKETVREMLIFITPRMVNTTKPGSISADVSPQGRKATDQQ
jgi:type IV pilus assembly protein PilQ